MARWEAPLPTSPACNARCLGCLSLQPADSCCPATQDRIGFTPTVAEILEIAVPHLERAPRAVASFGQGCEGEPLLVAPLIEEAVRAARARTGRGTLNLNTNASRPEALGRILDAGLDSVRVSLNSARPELYRAYARPQGYAFEDVVQSLREVRRRGKFLSLNYFVFPGVTDDPAEWAAFRRLLREVRPDLIQWRNLNLDPAWYWEVARPLAGGEPLGVATILDRVRREFPRVRFGYYNPPLRGPLGYR
jgi:MoaA/NifB/PqqE/SkfB family radical SAM enzyme